MTPEAFVALLASCSLALPPGITPDRLLAYAQVESGLNPAAVSRPNRDGSKDYGLLQVNEQHFRRFGVAAAQALEPCTNLRMGVAILAEADRAAACRYNTGRLACSNGYPERIQAAAARQSAPVISPPPAPPPEPTGSWDVWALPAPEPALPEPAARPEAPPADEPRLVVEIQNGGD